MKIHHLNCGSLNPKYPPLHSIVYCLLLETEHGLVLVDTGFGRQDYSNPSRMMAGFLWLMGVPRDEEETAFNQVKSLGYDPRDIEHIVLTHLHLDHAGGLRDFPGAKIHVFKGEFEAAMSPRGLVERGCDAAHWAHEPDWVLHDRAGEEWFGFPGMEVLEGKTDSILLIPLPGHTRGHCGAAIKSDDGWLFNCGDAASPFHRDVDPHGYPADKQPLKIIPGWLSRRLIGPHVPRLRKLIAEHGDEINLISSHDIYSFEKNTAKNAAGEGING
ncbi:MAG: MBL fold metallo-hydrolase [Anaerolineales bacterium]|nr:MBL fold metallo-hydrolase [Anaerolineales bacterium]